MRRYERLAAHYLKYLAIYFVLAQTFLLSSLDKWTSGGTPEYFIKQFEKTFLAKFPGVPFAYYTLAVMEGLVFILVVISFFRLEWQPDRPHKNWLKMSIAFAALTFGVLGFGENVSSNYTGAFQLFAYFGAALVVWLVVSADESAAARSASSPDSGT